VVSLKDSEVSVSLSNGWSGCTALGLEGSTIEVTAPGSTKPDEFCVAASVCTGVHVCHWQGVVTQMKSFVVQTFSMGLISMQCCKQWILFHMPQPHGARKCCTSTAWEPLSAHKFGRGAASEPHGAQKCRTGTTSSHFAFGNGGLITKEMHSSCGVQARVLLEAMHQHPHSTMFHGHRSCKGRSTFGRVC